jgi:hypothetical protein
MAALLFGQPTPLTVRRIRGLPPATLLCREQSTIPALSFQVSRFQLAGFDALGFLFDGVSHRVPGL